MSEQWAIQADGALIFAYNGSIGDKDEKNVGIGVFRKGRWERVIWLKSRIYAGPLKDSRVVTKIEMSGGVWGPWVPIWDVVPEIFARIIGSPWSNRKAEIGSGANIIDTVD